MIKILLVEDDVNLNALVKTVLVKNGYDVVSAYSGKEALKYMGYNAFSLVISDIMMSNIDGYELAKMIRETDKNIPILFMTAKDEYEDKLKSYSLGVDDYMVKPIDVKELVLRVGALLRRAKVNVERKLIVGTTTLDSDSLSVIEEGKETILPLKEFNILFKLLSNPGKIYTRSQIMNDCWGIYSESMDRTIDVHITHIREKFRNCPDFEIITVRGLGYKAVIKNEK